jgi:hypothetical protein
VCLNVAEENTILSNCDVRHVTDSNVTCLCRIDLDGIEDRARTINPLRNARMLSSDRATFTSLSSVYSSGEYIRTLKYIQNFHAIDETTVFEQTTLVLFSIFGVGGLLIVLSFVSYGQDNLGDRAALRSIKRMNKKKVLPHSFDPDASDHNGNPVITIEQTQDGAKDTSRVYDFDSEDHSFEEKSSDANFYPVVPNGKSATDIIDFKAIELGDLDRALPFVFQQMFSLKQKLYNELLVHHRWINVVAHPSEYYSRLMRVCALSAQVLCAGALQAAIYTYTNPDDGSCSRLSNERICIEEQSSYVTGHSKCVWALASHTCHFRQPDVSLQTVLIVAGLSAAMSVPVVHLMIFVMIKFSVPIVKPRSEYATAVAHDKNHLGGKDAHSSVHFQDDTAGGIFGYSPRARPPPTPTSTSGAVLPQRLRSAFNWGKSFMGLRRSTPSGPSRIVPVNSDDDQTTPNLIRQTAAGFTFGDGVVERAPKLVFNTNRIRCVSFVNAHPLEVEIEMFQRKLKMQADAMTFMNSFKDRADLLRK